MSITTFDLSNSIKIPSVGLGTYRIKNLEDMYTCLETAAKHKPLHIDTAQVYNNEHIIGKVLKSNNLFGLNRSDLFVTSKLSPKNQGFEQCTEAVNDSLSNLSLDYIDLYLIHWPGTQGLKSDNPKNSQNRFESWKALENLYKKGTLKAIGISNYSTEHLEELLNKCEIKPHVLQIELHPLYYPLELINKCKKNNIRIISYSSFGEGELLRDPKFKEYFQHSILKNTYLPDQILLGWCLYHSFGVIPKSLKPEHIKRNMESNKVVLNNKQIEYLDQISKQTTIKFCWDSENVK